jgi:hypothetical protein
MLITARCSAYSADDGHLFFSKNHALDLRFRSIELLLGLLAKACGFPF